MSYSKPQVTIDLEEYQELKAAAADSENLHEIHRVCKATMSVLLTSKISPAGYGTGQVDSINSLLKPIGWNLKVSGKMDRGLLDPDGIQFERIK